MDTSTDYQVCLTEAQKNSVIRELIKRQSDGLPNYMSIECPIPLLGDHGAVVMKCNYRSGGHIFLVIEPDGHTHS
jgi:hypothetical protein